jgi:peptidoglycan/LPS O-acetylase OafA/YrhL
MQKKMEHLEAAQGLASIVVVFHHFFLAFLLREKAELENTPHYFWVNGEAAVNFFFVLSGFGDVARTSNRGPLGDNGRRSHVSV